jgi:DNA topoisomerase I
MDAARTLPPIQPAPPAEAARLARLRYVSDRAPGIVRVVRGASFVYRGPSGEAVAKETLARIRSLAVPPAWTEVWICADPRGHLQATGRDARGRKQYRYHPRWREIRDDTKFERLLLFGQALPRIRKRVGQDLALPGLPRVKVLAAVVALLERTLARVGNAEYARDNRSFGITTLQNRHVRVGGGRIELDFRAKHGIRHRSVVADRKLARIIRNCRELPGSELFQFLDETGARHSIDSEDVNEYLREIADADITAKDFRTWAATNLALLALGARRTDRPTKKTVIEVVKDVARRLGNTPAVCRKCYIHPDLFDAYLSGTLTPIIDSLTADERNAMRTVEAALMRFLAV